MPTADGSWAPNSSTNQRMRLSVTWDVPTPSAGQSSVTVTGTVRVHAGYSFYHNGATFAQSGSLLGSATYSKNVNVPTNGSQVIHTFSQSVALTSSAQSKSLQFSLTGISYVGSGTKAAVNTTVSIPARVEFPQPIPPRSTGIARVSLTRIRLTWDGGAAHDIHVRARPSIGTTGSLTSPWAPWQILADGTFNSGVEFNVQAGYEWQARMRRVANGVWSDWSNPTGVARLFDPPVLPSSVVATSQSDTRQVVTWSATSTQTNPIVSQRIQRWSYTSGSYVTVATVAATARSWVDTVGFANNRGRYRVQTYNAAGYSTVAYSNYFYTTPAAPTILSVSRTGPTTVAITWQINARQITSQSVQQQTSSDGGVTWSGWSNVAGHTDFGTTVTSRTITGLNAALQYRFRVTANSHNDAPNPNRFGYSTASAIIRPAARPNAPTMLAPSGTVSTMDPVQARWRHNPADGSAQTAYELRYRLQGGSWTTLSGTGTATDTRDLPIAVPGTYEVQVRTKGQHADYSDWSPPAVFEALNPPGVTIVEPEQGGVIESNRASVFATFEDETGSSATSWRAELVRAGEVIENRSGLGWSVFGDRIWFSTELENFTEYTIRLWITSGTGLESAPAEVTFTTDFLLPTPPTLSAEWEEEEGLVRLGIENYPGVTYSWAGTANATESIMTREGTVVARNKVLSPIATSTNTWEGTRVTTAADPDERRTPETPTPFRATVNDASSTVQSFSSPSSPEGSRFFLAGAGAPVYVSLWLRAEFSGQFVLQLQEYTSTGVALNPPLAAPVVTVEGGVWTRLERVFTPRSTGVTARILVANAGTTPLPVGTVLHVSEPLLVWGTTPTEYFDGDYPSTVDTEHNRIERSTDLGQSWTIVADNLPVESGFDDDTVPLSTTVWYRAVAVSSWMTEAYSNVVEVRTDSDKLWLTGLRNGVKLMLECDLKLDVNFAQERVSEEYYGRTWPYSHYGERRGLQVTVGAGWTIKGIPCSEGVGTTNDPHDLLGQDLLYRDPVGRAFRAGFTSDIQFQQQDHWSQSIGFSVERVSDL